MLPLRWSAQESRNGFLLSRILLFSLLHPYFLSGFPAYTACLANQHFIKIWLTEYRQFSRTREANNLICNDHRNPWKNKIRGSFENLLFIYLCMCVRMYTMYVPACMWHVHVHHRGQHVAEALPFYLVVWEIELRSSGRKAPFPTERFHWAWFRHSEF